MSQKFPGSRKIIHVPHLGGIDVSYHICDHFDSKKPSLVLINSFATSADLYEPQFNDTKLNEKVNLIAIEPLGHGNTRLSSTTSETFTFWDTAYMNLQLLDALGIKKAFVLGTSQGGFIATRMALLRPESVYISPPSS
jgi:pimeloyl-ACP methyl ester carboxylesterase